MDPKQMVAQGYDQIAERYYEEASRAYSEERQQCITFLVEHLPARASVLELGCGVGLPIARLLAECFQVTGVDISARHIALARQHVPEATFLHADMTALDFAPASFDAAVAFYSIIHVPRGEQPGLFRDIAGWLKPGGLFVATMGAGDVAEEVQSDWLGAPMYWSHFDSATNRRLVQAAGLHIVIAVEETMLEDGVPVTFLWMIAKKPGVYGNGEVSVPDVPDPAIIRPATLADAPAIAEVHVRSWQWAYRGQLPDEYLDGLSDTLERRVEARRAALANLPPEHRWWIAEQAGQIVGFAITEPSRDDGAPPLTGEVALIYLLPEAAGKGIGRALFARAVADLRERGYQQAILWVLEGNARARRFYEAAGWRPDGARKTEERPGALLHEVRYAIALF
ncbi:MAG TPA: GNAT family N-acetyltransferase [Ktedonobacterales bacterium]